MANETIVIVPVHNEEDSLERLLSELLRKCEEINADILAIDDASTDHSLSIIKRFGIDYLQHPTQLGYGSTIQTGYKYAKKHNYNYLIQIDGDNQHDPRFLSDILLDLKTNRADLIIGSRFLAPQENPIEPRYKLYKGTIVRRLGIYIFRAILYILTLKKFTDPTSGYIGMNSKVVTFASGKSFPFDYPDADMIITFLKNGFRIKEIPIYMYHTKKTQSLHRGCRPLWYVIKVSIAILIACIRRKEIVQ